MASHEITRRPDAERRHPPCRVARLAVPAQWGQEVDWLGIGEVLHGLRSALIAAALLAAGPVTAGPSIWSIWKRPGCSPEEALRPCSPLG